MAATIRNDGTTVQAMYTRLGLDRIKSQIWQHSCVTVQLRNSLHTRNYKRQLLRHFHHGHILLSQKLHSVLCRFSHSRQTAILRAKSAQNRFSTN